MRHRRYLLMTISDPATAEAFALVDQRLDAMKEELAPIPVLQAEFKGMKDELVEFRAEYREDRRRGFVVFIAEWSSDNVPVPKLGEVKLRTAFAMSVMLIGTVLSLGLGDVVRDAGSRGLDYLFGPAHPVVRAVSPQPAHPLDTTPMEQP